MPPAKLIAGSRARDRPRGVRCTEHAVRDVPGDPEPLAIGGYERASSERRSTQDIRCSPNDTRSVSCSGSSCSLPKAIDQQLAGEPCVFWPGIADCISAPHRSQRCLGVSVMVGSSSDALPPSSRGGDYGPLRRTRLAPAQALAQPTASQVRRAEDRLHVCWRGEAVRMPCPTSFTGSARTPSTTRVTGSCLPTPRVVLRSMWAESQSLSPRRPELLAR